MHGNLDYVASPRLRLGLGLSPLQMFSTPQYVLCTDRLKIAVLHPHCCTEEKKRKARCFLHQAQWLRSKHRDPSQEIDIYLRKVEMGPELMLQHKV